MSQGQPLSGKTAIVTGASSGIGRAIAEKLGRAGAQVYFAGRTREAMDALRIAHQSRSIFQTTFQRRNQRECVGCVAAMRPAQGAIQRREFKGDGA